MIPTLLGVKRTWRGIGSMSANDPKWTSVMEVHAAILMHRGYRKEEILMKTLGIAAVLALLLAAPAVAATDENIGMSIETLLKAGWQIAGYAAANQRAVESAMILLRNPNESYLVQCRASYDVTRRPSVTMHCYKLL
jgi:hypothetical protein